MLEKQSPLEVIKVEQNGVTFFELPGNKKLQRTLNNRRYTQQKGVFSHDHILTTLKKHRGLMIVNRNIVLSPDDELYILLINKLHGRNIPAYFLDKQSEVLDVIKVIQDIYQNSLEADTKDSHKETTFNQKSNCKAVPARQSHSTSVVDVFEMSAYPLDNADYSKPLYPSSERSNVVKESKPIQATDSGIDSVDSSLLATNFTPQNRLGLASRFQSTDSITYGGPSSGNPSLAVSTDGYLSSLYRPGRENIHFNATSRVDDTTYIPKQPKYPDYVLQATRSSSFQSQKWEVSCKPEIRTLVAFGFFYTGTGDLVRCYQCGIGLKDWVRDDDVLAEHIKYSSACDFLRQKLGQSEVERLKNALTSDEDNQSDQPTCSTYQIRSPRYQTMEARLASFESFPSIGINHQTLAVAGLFFTGNGDLCRCFACDGGLKDWSNGDDPIQEHATYFPTCPYINQLKGADYVKQMQERRAPSVPTVSSGQVSRTQEKNQIAKPKVNQHHACSQGSPNDVTSQITHAFAGLSSANTTSSTAFIAQVFQQLGYTEQEVTSARIELEMKGNTNPTSEDIVNTILDTKERAEIQQLEATAKATAKHDNKNNIKEMLEENQRLSEIVHCKLCVTGEPDILFLPCAHHKICHKCSENLTHCPICRKQIKQKVKTYRS